jgi:hypothetical protein
VSAWRALAWHREQHLRPYLELLYLELLFNQSKPKD